MRARSAANSADSSPPSPDLTSSTTSSASCGSRGASRSVSWVSSSATRALELGRPRRRTTSSSAASSRAAPGRRARPPACGRWPRSATTCANRRPTCGRRRRRRAVRDRPADVSRSACSASSASIAGARVGHLGLLWHAALNLPTKRRPACARAAERAPIGAASCRQLCVSPSLRSAVALAVALLEAGHTAAAVEDLLLAGVERMALRADLDHDVAALLGAAGL